MCMCVCWFYGILKWNVKITLMKKSIHTDCAGQSERQLESGRKFVKTINQGRVFTSFDTFWCIWSKAAKSVKLFACLLVSLYVCLCVFFFFIVNFKKRNFRSNSFTCLLVFCFSFYLFSGCVLRFFKFVFSCVCLFAFFSFFFVLFFVVVWN